MILKLKFAPVQPLNLGSRSGPRVLRACRPINTRFYRGRSCSFNLDRAAAETKFTPKRNPCTFARTERPIENCLCNKLIHATTRFLRELDRFLHSVLSIFPFTFRFLSSPIWNLSQLRSDALDRQISDASERLIETSELNRAVSVILALNLIVEFSRSSDHFQLCYWLVNLRDFSTGRYHPVKVISSEEISFRFVIDSFRQTVPTPVLEVILLRQ